MKALNPLYVLATLVVLFIGMLFTNHSLHQSIQEAHDQTLQLEREVREIMQLQKRYKNSKASRKEVEKWVRHSLVKPFIKYQKIGARSASLKINGIQRTGAKWLINKIANFQGSVKKLEIKRQKTTLEIELEVTF